MGFLDCAAAISQAQEEMLACQAALVNAEGPAADKSRCLCYYKFNDRFKTDVSGSWGCTAEAQLTNSTKELCKSYWESWKVASAHISESGQVPIVTLSPLEAAGEQYGVPAAHVLIGLLVVLLVLGLCRTCFRCLEERGVFHSIGESEAGIRNFAKESSSGFCAWLRDATASASFSRAARPSRQDTEPLNGKKQRKRSKQAADAAAAAATAGAVGSPGSPGAASSPTYAPAQAGAGRLVPTARSLPPVAQGQGSPSWAADVQGVPGMPPFATAPALWAADPRGLPGSPPAATAPAGPLRPPTTAPGGLPGAYPVMVAPGSHRALPPPERPEGLRIPFPGGSV